MEATETHGSGWEEMNAVRPYESWAEREELCGSSAAKDGEIT